MAEVNNIEEYKRSVFSDYISYLLVLTEHVSERLYGKDTSNSEVLEVLDSFKSYVKFYEKVKITNPYILHKGIKSFYVKNRTKILNQNDSFDNDWIKSKEILIEVSFKKPSLIEKISRAKILIGNAYEYCLVYSNKEIELSLDYSGGSEDFETDCHIELMYYLSVLFWCLQDLPQKEYDDLSKIIKLYQNKIPAGRKREKDRVNLEYGKTKQNTENGQGGMFQMVANMMSSLGIPIPEGMKMPKDNEIQDVIKTVLSNDSTQTMMKKVLSSIPKDGEMRSPEDLGNVMQNVMKTVGEEGALSTLKETVESAVSNKSQSSSSSSSSQ